MAHYNEPTPYLHIFSQKSLSLQKNIMLVDRKKVHATIQTLALRIESRFPKSGLGKVCQSLLTISERSLTTIEWIEKPNYWARGFFYVFMTTVIVILLASLKELNLKFSTISIADLIQVTEAITSEIVLLSAGIFFLYNYEKRMKRNKIVKAVNELRAIIHLIDMHQLTKDPYVYLHLEEHKNTPYSPKREMSALELNRYLDYCSEMLALTSKLGFLYVQGFHDDICINIVNDLEQLSVALSEKIWQKISVLK